MCFTNDTTTAFFSERQQPLGGELIPSREFWAGFQKTGNLVGSSFVGSAKTVTLEI
jgi:hypothetical protein